MPCLLPVILVLVLVLILVLVLKIWSCLHHCYPCDLSSCHALIRLGQHCSKVDTRPLRSSVFTRKRGRGGSLVGVVLPLDRFYELCLPGLESEFSSSSSRCKMPHLRITWQSSLQADCRGPWQSNSKYRDSAISTINRNPGPGMRFGALPTCIVNY